MFFTIFTGLTLGLAAISLVGQAATVVYGQVARPRRSRPKGRLRTVRGIARGLHRPSPIERLPCLFAWVRLSTFERGKIREVAVGPDFVLESPEGRFTVRIDGLRLRGAPEFPPRQPLGAIPPGPLDDTIESAKMKLPWGTEVHVRDGDLIEVTGLCRLEPAPPGEVGAGFRGDAMAWTLTGAGHRLDVRWLG